jgi:formamidase
MHRLHPYAVVALAGVGLAAPAQADTSDVTWQSRVVVAKEGAHCVDDPNCFNRYHPAIPAVARANPGDHIVFETRDALDSDLDLDSTADDVTALDLNLVHPMTGPVHIEGAEQGDVLAITLVDIEPDQYGYTVIVPGFGFLRDLFPDPYVVNWKLDRQAATSDEMPGVRVPMAAFMGSVGVLPGDTEVKTWLDRETALAEAGGVALPPEPTGALPADVCGPNGSHPDQCLRTIPPRENGGNMDVQQMQIGTTLLLPCFIDGCGLFVGDVHYAQGDGEVSGTAIETPVQARLTLDVDEELRLEWPVARIRGAWLTVGMDASLGRAARIAVDGMVALMGRELGVTGGDARVLASVGVDLHVTQVVNGVQGVHAILRDDAFRM